jgi:CubicO group peptidase (beta-lactamase class C family)
MHKQPSRFQLNLLKSLFAVSSKLDQTALKKLFFLSSAILLCAPLIGCQDHSGDAGTEIAEQASMSSIAISDEKAAQIDALFAKYDDLYSPGSAVAVVQDGEVVFKKGYGSANLEYDIPVSPSTIFHIASVSKQFTVFAVLLLEEEGKLNFDDDIRKYISEVPDFGEVITLRHLASHTSGMRDQWNLLAMAGWRLDDVITKEHVFKLVEKQKELNFQPGDEYLYSNTGFTLLAEVVARVTGKSFAEFTQERMFTPLGMSNTLFYDDHQKIVKNRAYSYAPTDDGYQKSVLNYAIVGATSLFTTVEDLSLWAMHFEDIKVGSQALIDKMNTLAVLNNGETFGGAYGQFISDHNGLEYIQHGGADAGYRAFFARFPEQGFAVSVFNNVAIADPRSLALGVADIFLKDKMLIAEDMTEAYLDLNGEEDIEFIGLDEVTLEKFVGHYWNDGSSYSREIYIKDGVLMYSRGAENVSPLAPISEDLFKMLEVDADLFVRFDAQLATKQMIVTEGDDVPIVSTAYNPSEFTTKNLMEYAGTYYSEELSTSIELVPNEGSLIVSHSRNSDAIITPIKDNIFTSEVWVLRNIRFERDTNNALTGMRISNGRVRNLYFEKR